MLPKYHLVLGIFFVAIIYFLFHINFFDLSIILLSSILIDVDHFVYYFFKKKNIHFLKAYDWYMERWKKNHTLPREQKRKLNLYSGFYLFHGIEILITLFLFSYYIPILFFIFIGFSFHLFVDLIYDLYDRGTFDKSSLIYNYFKFRSLKKNNSI